MKIFSFNCYPKGKEEWSRIINSNSKGRAKSEYWREINESWDVPFTAIRAQKVGAPQTSYSFVRNAVYRGLPDVKCGQRVKVGDSFGFIVGHNSYANFDVLFDADSKYPNLTLNVHPDGMEIVK